jgi:hypothetical protein
VVPAWEMGDGCLNHGSIGGVEVGVEHLEVGSLARDSNPSRVGCSSRNDPF